MKAKKFKIITFLPASFLKYIVSFTFYLTERKKYNTIILKYS